MISPSSGSSTTTARLTTVPVPRMPTCGWLMIGVSNSAPRLPVLVSVKVPPDSSSGRDLVGPGALGQVGDPLGQTGQVEVAGVADDRHQQAALGVDRDAQVLGVVVGDRAGVQVDRGVDVRVDPQRLDRGEREERQERQLHAVPRREVGLGRVAEPGDLGDVDLDHGGQLRRDLQRLDHALGDDLTHAGHLLGATAQRAAAPVTAGGLPRSRRRPRRRCGGRRLLGLGRGEHVLLADAATDAGAGQRAEADAVLGGELADQRGDVGGVVAVDRTGRPVPGQPGPATGATGAAATGAGAGAGGGAGAAAGAGAARRGGAAAGAAAAERPGPEPPGRPVRHRRRRRSRRGRRRPARSRPRPP